MLELLEDEERKVKSLAKPRSQYTFPVRRGDPGLRLVSSLGADFAEKNANEAGLSWNEAAQRIIPGYFRRRRPSRLPLSWNPAILTVNWKSAAHGKGRTSPRPRASSLSPVVAKAEVT